MILGATEPRIFTPPLRELTEDTSLGFLLIQFARDCLGVKLLPWQEWLAIHTLETVDTADGQQFRFRTVLVELSRQNGKSTFSKVLALFFMYVMHSGLVIGTAQNLDTSEEVFDGAVELINDNPELAAKVEKIYNRIGQKTLKLIDGQRYKVASLARGSCRGLASDLVMLDELREHSNWEAWGSITATTTARPNAVIWCMSNAGDDSSVVLRHLRVQAHLALGDPDGIAAKTGASLPEGEPEEDDTLAIFEWSAHPNADPADREEWALANPSLGYGFLTERTLSSALKTDPEPVFRTEHLCQWVEAVIEQPFPDGAWGAGVDPYSEIDPEAELTFGVDVSADRAYTALAVCGLRPDGEYHVEIIQHRAGTAWLMEWLTDRAKREPVRIAFQGRGAPVSSYLQDLQSIEGVEAIPCEGRDLGAWTGRFYDGVAACLGASDAIPIRHRPQPVLDTAARIAQKKSLGDAAYAWDRARSAEDISPLIAATMAFGLTKAGKTEIVKSYESAYSLDDRGVIFV